MNRAELESTAPIKRDELLELLNAMTPQPSTARARASDEAAHARAARKAAKRAARKAAKRAAKAKAAAKAETTAPRLFDDDVEWDDLLTVAVSAMITPKTPEPVMPVMPTSTSESSRAKRMPPFSQIAALLAPCEPTRFPRATRPPLLRASTPRGAMTDRSRAEQKAAQAVAEVRARLDTAEETAAERIALRERVSALSPHVVAHLSAEEIAMLPMEIRLTLPEIARSKTPRRIERSTVPSAGVISIHSVPCRERGHSIRLTAGAQTADPLRLATIIASFAATFLLGLCAVYFLL